MPVLSKDAYANAIRIAYLEGKDQGFKEGYEKEKPQDYEPAPPPKQLLKRAQKAVQLNQLIVDSEQLASNLYLKAMILKKFPEAVVFFDEEQY